jgi:hypothetical protein
MDTSKPYCSGLRTNVISRQISSCQNGFIIPGSHFGILSEGMISPFHPNSVGPPQPTPTIWPIHPPIILSRCSRTGNRRSFSAPCANHAQVLRTKPATTTARINPCTALCCRDVLKLHLGRFRKGHPFAQTFLRSKANLVRSILIRLVFRSRKDPGLCTLRPVHQPARGFPSACGPGIIRSTGGKLSTDNFLGGRSWSEDS